MNYSLILERFENSPRKLFESITILYGSFKAKKTIISLVLFYYVLRKCHMAFFGPLSQVPGPFYTRFFKLPRIILEIPKGTAFQKIKRLHDQYGEIVRTGPTSILVSNKELIREIMITRDLPKGDIYLAMQKESGHTLLTTTDKSWHKNRRKILSPAFSIKYLSSLEPFMVSCIDAFISKIDKEILLTKDTQGYGTIDIWSLLSCLSVDILGETSFGESFNMVEKNDHIIPRAISGLLVRSSIRVLFPTASNLLLLSRSDPRQDVKKFVAKIVNERLNDPSKERNDILQVLINSQKSQLASDRLTLDEIIYESILFLVAGSDTTSSATGFAFYELLNRPEKLAKLRKEIDSIDVDENGSFQYSQLKTLPYLDAVVNETLRLNPANLTGFMRLTTEETVLGNLTIPKNTSVFLNGYNMQTNEKYWPNPLEFIPERWIEKENCDMDAYMPFSLGSRNCIGKNFAFQEIKSIIAKVLRNYDIQPIESEMEHAKIRRQFITHRMKNDSFYIKMKQRSRETVTKY